MKAAFLTLFNYLKQKEYPVILCNDGIAQKN